MARYGRELSQTKRPNNIKNSVFARLYLDAAIEKGIFFNSAGVEQDSGASLPHKLLMLGFR